VQRKKGNSQVEVLDSLLRIVVVDEGSLEEVKKLLCDTESSPRVGREVDSWRRAGRESGRVSRRREGGNEARTRKSEASSELSSLEEVVVLERSEGSDLEGDIVGDDLRKKRTRRD